MKRESDVVVVGAGFAGIYLVHKLGAAGLSVQGIERGSDVGGTWYWNRYPGARCDIPSLLYSFTFSDDIRRTWRWSEKYAAQPELLAYAGHVADAVGAREHYRFDTTVTRAAWNDVRERWTVETDRGETFEARWLVMATGCLSVPRGRDLPGADRFKGASYVTGQWPHDGVDFSGKRVAVVGTGSSAIQSVPLIAEQAAHVTVFQRTPNFSLPALNRPLEDAEHTEFETGFADYKAALAAGEPGIPLPPADWVPGEEEIAPLVEQLWNGWGLLSTAMIPNLTRDQRINDAAAAFVRAKVAEIVRDPETARRLTPGDFPIATKRACVDTDWYATFNRDNVSLVDLRETNIVTVDETGIQTGDGHVDADAIVYALGFDAMTGALTRIDIRGADGRSLKEQWQDGPQTYLGLAVPNFPNMFTVTGPQSPSVLSNMLASIEIHVEWIATAIAAAGDRRFEASEDATADWVAHANAEADKTLYPRAASWYMGANIPGKPRVFMPYVGDGYKQRIDREAAEGYPGFRIGAVAELESAA
jgi:cation diffusion facilitator CzcD-associated flavoprotein CzcO